MKAIRIHEFGGSGQLRVEEVAQPAPGAGEVLVRVARAGVNPVDWKIREGALGRRGAESLPATLGQDFAGEIAAAGDEGRFRPGQRVFGFARSGAYAEFALAAEEEIAPVPDVLSLEIAAALPTPGLTAYQIVQEAVAPRREQTVLVAGAAGAVGALALQLLRHRGAYVTAADRPGERGYLMELGARQAIDAESADFERETGTVDAAIDLVGGEVQRRCLRVVRRGGVLASTVGIGERERGEAERLGVRAIAFYMRRSAGDLASVGELAAQGVLRPRIARVLPLDQARAAQELSQQGEAHGKLLLAA